MNVRMAVMEGTNWVGVHDLELLPLLACPCSVVEGPLLLLLFAQPALNGVLNHLSHLHPPICPFLRWPEIGAHFISRTPKSSRQPFTRLAI